MDNYDAYLRAGASGDLTGRVVGALWWDRAKGLEQIDDLVALREGGTSGRFRATSVKIMQDGVCENFTAAVLDPYLDESGQPTDNRGISFVDPEVLDEAVTRLDALGFQVHYHALAERAVREALDAIAAARRANGWTDGRHHLAHIQVVHPDDLPRFRELGAVANAQPLWAAHEAQMDELTIPFLGAPRWTWQYPFGSLLRHGAQLAMGSDWSVSTPDPLEEMHVAVNRQMPADYAYRVDNRDVFLPDERLDLASAIHGFTMGSAYVNHADAGDRVDRARQAGRPRRDRPQPVRAPGRRDRVGTLPRHLRGRRTGVRGRGRLAPAPNRSVARAERGATPTALPGRNRSHAQARFRRGRCRARPVRLHDAELLRR